MTVTHKLTMALRLSGWAESTLVLEGLMGSWVKGR